MTTATVNRSLTDEQYESIGLFVDANHMTHCSGGIALVEAGASKSQILTTQDQEAILWHTGVLGDDRIANELFGHDEPQHEMVAGAFVMQLMSVMRKFSKQALRQEILERTKGARVVSFKNRSGGRIVVHPAARTDADSDWQLSTISSNGMPWGHNNPPTFEEAIFRASGVSEDGYWNEHGYTYEWSDNSGEKPPA